MCVHTTRLGEISQLLDTISARIPGLNDKTDVSLRNVPISEYVRAIGMQHEVNVYISDTPDQLITSNLVDEPVKSVFLFICKNFDYSIQVTGTIIEFLPYIPPDPIPAAPQRKPIDLVFDGTNLSVDLKNDSLPRVLEAISRLTGRKLLTRPGTEGLLTAYLPATPLDTALEAIFVANGYRLIPRRKGYYLVESTLPDPGGATTSPLNSANSTTNPGRMDFIVDAFTDGVQDYISVEAEEADLQELIKTIFLQLDSDYIIYEVLDGTVTINAELTQLDKTLRYLFQATNYTFRRDGDLYLIGPKSMEGLQTFEMVRLRYRPTFQAMELIPGADITYEQQSTRTNLNQTNLNQGVQNGNLNNPRFNNGATFNNQGVNSGFNSFNSPYSSIGGRGGYVGSSEPPSILKTRVGQVEMVDYPELNRIILKGPAEEVAEMKSFLEAIDQPVPMVKVEMIVVEVNKDRLLNTGLRAGLRTAGDSTIVNKDVLPGLDYTLDGGEINTLLGSVPELANLGVLNQNIYVQLKAQEERGNLRMKMRPVLSMLNGREASLVIGQTQYFLLETTTTSNGAVNSYQQFTQRFERIDANITLTLKPYISDDGMVTLDVMPDFTSPVGQLTAEVPPTISTRRFVSTIRVRDGATVILGGLSEEATNENTSGLPWLSRIPVLKWIFGNVQKRKQDSSLLIYLTPVIYYN